MHEIHLQLGHDLHHGAERWSLSHLQIWLYVSPDRGSDSHLYKEQIKVETHHFGEPVEGKVHLILLTSEVYLLKSLTDSDSR